MQTLFTLVVSSLPNGTVLFVRQCEKHLFWEETEYFVSIFVTIAIGTAEKGKGLKCFQVLF